MYNTSNRNQKNNVKSRLIKSYLVSWLNEGHMPNFSGVSNYELLVANNAFIATKNFHNEINEPNVTVSSVMSALKEMKRSTKQFEILYGIPWPLLFLYSSNFVRNTCQ